MNRTITVFVSAIVALGVLAGGASAASSAPGVTALPRAASAPHPGWTGEQLFGSTSNDDWEPAVAADPLGAVCLHPDDPLRRQEGVQGLPGPGAHSAGLGRRRPDIRCRPVPVRVQGRRRAERSADRGGHGTGPSTPHGSTTSCRASCFRSHGDHGRTWTDPITLKTPAIEFGDKPALAISPTGRDVYVAWNASDSYISVSHDFGATVRRPDQDEHGHQVLVRLLGRRGVGWDGDLQRDHVHAGQHGPVRVEVIRSTDGGKHWHDVHRRYRCPAAAVRLGRLSARVLWTVGTHGDGCDGATRRHVPGCVRAVGPAARLCPALDGWRYARGRSGPTSTAGHRARMPPSAARPRPATATSVSGTRTTATVRPAGTPGSGGRRMAVCTWSAEVRLSDRRTARRTRRAAGFAQPYGDYGEVAITNTGATIAVWGEGNELQRARRHLVQTSRGRSQGDELSCGAPQATPGRNSGS